MALRKGSLVVNPSQGGGSKDTWVVAESYPEGSLAQVQQQMGAKMEQQMGETMVQRMTNAEGGMR